jgi:hypothetical protein
MKPSAYVYSPNNIHAEIREAGGREIYPAGPGVPTVPNCLIVADMGESIHLFAKQYGVPTGLALVMKFSSADSFLSYCSDQGGTSKGGQSGFY